MIKAFLCGVQNYKTDAAPLNCQIDIDLMLSALTNSLKINIDNITVLSNPSGYINKIDFIKTFNKFCASISSDDIILFYFSGHGSIIGETHYLILSDCILRTASLIDELNQFKNSEKIILLDCCYSGNVIADIENSDEVFSAVNKLSAPGINIFASCQKFSKSYVADKDGSGIFTYFLTRAIADKSIIRNGQISLWDIVTLTRFFIDIYCRERPYKSQHLTFRKFGLKDIYFTVGDIRYRHRIKHIIRFSDFYIADIEPLHSLTSKRYAVKVVMDIPKNVDTLYTISSMIVHTVRNSEIYCNDIQKSILTNKSADAIYIYFSLDEMNMRYGNFLIYGTWYADASAIPKLNTEKHMFYNNNIVYKPNNLYFHNNDYRNIHTANEKEYSSTVIKIANKTIAITNNLISYYNMMQNKECSLEQFSSAVQSLINSIDAIFYKSADFDFPPDKYYEFDCIIQDLISTAHNITIEIKQLCIGVNSSYNLDAIIKKYYDIVQEYVLCSKNQYS